MEDKVFLSDTEDDESSSSDDDTEAKIDNTEIISLEQPKTIITEDELNDLVRRVKSLIIIQSSSNLETNVENELKKFLTDANIKIVFLYMEGNSLRTGFTIPVRRVNMTYCIKRHPSKEITLKNFSNSLIFGNIDEKFENTLLQVFKSIYAVAFYSTRNLPYSIKIQLTKNLEEFLCSSTEKYFRQFGLSMIYTPAITMYIKDYVKLDDLLCLFEKVVVSWCNQLSDALFDNELKYQYIIDFSPLIMIEFWKYKLDNLLLIQKSLKMETAQSVCQILEEHHSVHVRLLYDLMMKLEERIQETYTNVVFLEMLKETSEKLEGSKLDMVLEIIPELILHTGIIISKSSYFKSEENSRMLIDSMSQQIMNICKRTIKLEDIFEGETENSMNAIIQSISVCLAYKEILDKSSENSSSKFFNSSIYSSQLLENVSQHVDIFVQRCVDLLKLCSLINIFYNAMELKDQRIRPEPYVNMAEKMSLISENFLKALTELKKAQKKVFHFQTNIWCDSNYRFQEEMETIAGEICGLVETAFSYVSTIEDAIDILRVFYQYSKWSPIKNIFEEKSMLVFDKFLQELNEIKDYLLTEKVKFLQTNMNNITKMKSIFIKKQRILFLYELVDSCNWLKVDNPIKVSEYQLKSKEVLSEINQILISHYKEWNKNISEHFLLRLQQPLIARCFYNPDLLQTNIDRKLLKVMKEANVWIQFGFTQTTIVEKLLSIRQQILILFGNVEDLILTHNRIVALLSSDEHLLFSPFMRTCMDVIKPAFCSLYWDNESSNKIALDYLKQMKYVESLVQGYKNQNKSIVHTCKEICQLNLVQVTKTNFNEIVDQFQECRLMSFKKLVSYYNQIVNCVQIIFDSFGYQILKIKKVWNQYVKKIDKLIKEALKCCLKTTLRYLLHHVSADAYTELTPIKINLLVLVKEKQLIFQPKLVDVKIFFYGTKINLFEMIKRIPQFFNTFKMSRTKKEKSYCEQLFKDDQINQLQKQINAGNEGMHPQPSLAFHLVEEKLQEVIIHTNKWKKYDSLWKMDVSDHIEAHITAFSDLDPYQIGFSSYNAIINEMQFSTTTENDVSMFRINSGKVISEVVHQCELRLERLSEVLKQQLHDRLFNIRTHIDKECMTLKNFKYESDMDLLILKSMFSEVAAIETEISRIVNYNVLLEKFKFIIEPELIEMKKVLDVKFVEYSNMIERWKKFTLDFHK